LLSGPVIQALGEIYQYVGDEMIITWELKKGTVDDNCLKCFFLMKKAMQEHSQKFKEKFGIIPTFKAGIHCGTVTTGEIGEIKKNILYTGDVLNTAARIQGLCKLLAVDLLISDDLFTKLENTASYIIQSKGNQQLTGRDEKVIIYAVNV
jgi:class 3 adenylate cyclase